MNNSASSSPPADASLTSTSSSVGAAKPTSPRSKVLRICILVCSAILLLLALLVLFRNPLLRSLAAFNLQAETGMNAEIGDLDLGFLSSSLAISDLKIYNPPDFGDSTLIDLPEIFLQLAPERSTQSQLVFQEIRLHLASLNVVKDHQGRLNLHSFSKSRRAAASKKKRRHSDRQLAGIDKLSLSLGSISYTDLAHPADNILINLNIENETVTNLKSEQEIKNWLGSLVARIALELYFKEPSLYRKAPWELFPNILPQDN